MNVKFRMPRLGRNNKSSGIIKELVLTTIATSISIILTFGTAHYFEQKQKKADARLMAMMVIYDMDNTAKQLREAGENNVNQAGFASYVWENFARLDSIEEDVMKPALSYIVQESSAQRDYPLDDASEKIFISSQDSWKNINNPVRPVQQRFCHPASSCTHCRICAHASDFSYASRGASSSST